jgi:hypothetical protein
MKSASRTPAGLRDAEPNHALEQAAIPSRSWQTRQGAGPTGPARQERSVPPLLTAGVRLARNALHCRYDVDMMQPWPI